MAWNAATPPAELSLEICDTANDGSLTVVSTRTILIPAAAAAFNGACMAATSVGATRIASGFDATTEATIGFCSLDAALHGNVEFITGDALNKCQGGLLCPSRTGTTALGASRHRKAHNGAENDRGEHCFCSLHADTSFF